MANNSLYMVCPTDQIEDSINTNFEGRNFFYTSLGNSVKANYNTYFQIAQLVETHAINTITFVLSENNQIILDALNKQRFNRIKMLAKSYAIVLNHKHQASHFYKNANSFTLSYFLNEKINELQTGLKNFLIKVPTINAQIVSTDGTQFTPALPHLLCLSSIHLN